MRTNYTLCRGAAFPAKRRISGVVDSPPGGGRCAPATRLLKKSENEDFTVIPAKAGIHFMIFFFCKMRSRLGLLKKPQESIVGCVHAFEFHSPLEGESKRPSGLCEGRFGGGSFSVACPPTNSPAGFALVSLTPPQGGSEIRCAPSVDFFNSPHSGRLLVIRRQAPFSSSRRLRPALLFPPPACPRPSFPGMPR